MNIELQLGGTQHISSLSHLAHPLQIWPQAALSFAPRPFLAWDPNSPLTQVSPPPCSSTAFLSRSRNSAHAFLPIASGHHFSARATPALNRETGLNANLIWICYWTTAKRPYAGDDERVWTEIELHLAGHGRRAV